MNKLLKEFNKRAVTLFYNNPRQLTKPNLFKQRSNYAWMGKAF